MYRISGSSASAIGVMIRELGKRVLGLHAAPCKAPRYLCSVWKLAFLGSY